VAHFEKGVGDERRIDGTTRVNSSAWNQVVSHLTRGLLFGHEVQKPQWYRPQRKNARSRRLHAAPALKREAVFTRLMNGWTPEQIALHLLISKDAVELHTQRICKQERVKNRRELAAKLGWKHEQPLNGREKLLALAREKEEQVLPLILEGLSWQEIASRTGLKLWNVHQALRRIYKKHGLAKRQGKRALGRKFGIELPRFGRGPDQRPRKCAVAAEQGIPGAARLPIPPTSTPSTPPSSTSSASIT